MELKPIFNIDTRVDQTEYYWFQQGFSEEELGWFNNLKDLYPFEIASIVGSTTPNTEVRNSRIKWLHYDERTDWVYEKLKNFSIEANNTIWGFNLTSIIDSIQYTEYPEGGGHYDCHVDIGPGSINHRKISIVTQLSDPSEYEGGELQLKSQSDTEIILNCPKGRAWFFPSYVLHRVTPVTKGVRKSLVLWAGGPEFR